MGVHILRPPAAGILYPPPFYTPPTPRRVFSGEGGWVCIKFGPVDLIMSSVPWEHCWILTLPGEVYLSGQPDCVDHAKKLIDET